mgnify:CR=1 FL=1
MTNEPTKLAYAAGIIDGEGTICAPRKSGARIRQMPVPIVAVNMSDPRVIRWLQVEFGGSFYTTNRESRPAPSPGEPVRRDNRHPGDAGDALKARTAAVHFGLPGHPAHHEEETWPTLK